MTSNPQVQQQKPSRWVKLWNVLTSPEQEKREYQEEKVTGNAIRIVADGKLEKRLKAYNETLRVLIEENINTDSTLHQYCLDLMDMLKTLHLGICLIAGPYARSGDNPKFSRMMHGWNKLYSNWLSKLTRADMFFDTNEKFGGMTSINEVTIKNLHLGLLHHIFPDGYDVLDYCFNDKDVRERAVTMINTMMQGFNSPSPSETFTENE